MISDILSDAVFDISHYLFTCPDAYPPGHPITARIIACTAEMSAIQAVLDGAPGPAAGSQPRLRENQPQGGL